MSPANTPDVDRILEAIRAEARARGSNDRVGGYSRELPASNVRMGHPGMEAPEPHHVADLLALPLDVFIATAYRALLGREPDAAGAAHYQRQMLRGAITRAEVLGRLAFSGEGRRHGSTVAGVAPAFAFSLAYRVPVAGPALAIVARALRLPAHWQDRSTLEAAALAAGSWMKR